MRLSTILVFTTLSACGQGKNNSSNAPVPDTTIKDHMSLQDRYPSREKASPKAKALMNDDWYFSPIDDMAPFGSDDAADTYSYFYDWRKANLTGSPKAFVIAHFERWNYPRLNLESTDYNDFRPFLQQSALGSRYLFGMDAAIIATAFGQLYLEGKIDDDIREFARKAIKRELLPEILDTWKNLRSTREKRLNDFVQILDACN